MTSFINEIVQPANLHATVLLLFVMLYWLLVIVGAAGMDAFDFDADADIDGDFDVDAGESVLGALMTFFHLGEVPVMLIASFFGLFFWLTTIFTNHYLNPDLNLLTTAVWMIPCFIVSLIGTKLVLLPIAPLFRSVKTPYARRENMVGKKAEVFSLELDEKFGEIVLAQKGPPLVLNARTVNGQRLKKGETVKIVRIDEANNCIVELAKWESKEV